MQFSLAVHQYHCVLGEPYMRGFFCSDESIRHPYLDSTVPTWALILISYSLPAIIIALVETALLKHSDSFSYVTFSCPVYMDFIMKPVLAQNLSLVHLIVT